MSLTRAVLDRLGEAVRAQGEPLDEGTPPEGGPCIGRYVLLAEVGGGSGGVVWHAWDPLLERHAALKILREPTGAEAGAPEASLRAHAAEFAAMAKLEGAAFVEVFDVGLELLPEVVFGASSDEAKPHAFCAMEWVPGGSAAELLAAGPMEPRAAAELIRDVARGLGRAHRAGILHLDIKPSNVLLAPGGPKLCDFGAMRGLFEAGERGARPAGTIGFLAPEQALGRESEIGPRSDVYGLGATLAALACGTALPSDDDLEAVDPALAAIFERAMARDPEARYASAVGLAAALDGYLAPDASGTPAATHSSRQPSRRLLWSLAGLAGLALFALLLGKTLGGAEQSSTAQTTARYDEVVSAFAQRSGPPASWSLAERLELLGARAGALLSRFSFHPADLELFAALAERGQLARDIERLVRDQQQQLMQRALPSEVVAFRRLDTYIDAQDAGSGGASLSLAHGDSSDRFARLEAAMEALIDEQPGVAEAHLAGLADDDESARLLGAAADLESRGRATDRAALDELSERHAFLHSDLGLLDLLEDEPARALEHFEAALESYPGLASARHHRIVALWRLGRHAEARQALAGWTLEVDSNPDLEWDTAPPSDFSIGSRSSAVYLWPSRQRLATDPWLADLRASL